ncbi:MAG: PP2C family protein-serine/threonine phosphatase [Erysipelotrichaceae bacterium]|nr:PP2C family protein-serine/threonine phosphatase [Erysipelotrichaceae bacterium]
MTKKNVILDDEHIRLFLIFTDIVLVLMLISIVVFIAPFSFDSLKSNFTFELALNTLSIFYSIMMTTILTFDYYYDIGLLSIFIPITLLHGITMWADEMLYVVQLWGWTKALSRGFFAITIISEILNIFLLWLYLRTDIHNKTKYNSINLFLYIQIAVNFVLAIVNVYNPILCAFNENYVITYFQGYYLIKFLNLVTLLIFVIAAILEKLPKYKKAILIGNPTLTIIGLLLYALFPKYYVSYAFVQLSFIATFIISYTTKTYDLSLKQNELIAASSMQQSMLPKDALLGANDEFYVLGAMRPAKEVGGDLYDYYMIDENHLCFGIGDVSGKGTASSLFMSRAFACFKNFASMNLSPEEIFIRVNNSLNERNAEFYFITAWLGILDINTGVLTYVNAGHERPLYVKKGGEADALESHTNIVLGISPNQVFKQNEIKLDKGDMIMLYTDGVEDEHNLEGVKFGFERLKHTFNEANKNNNYKDILNAINERIAIYMDGTDQYDDITMLLFRYGGDE